MTVVEEVREVPADGWRAAAEQAAAEGCTWFDMLTAVDDDEVFTVVCCLVDPAANRPLLLRTTVPREVPELASLTPLFAGADWHERETAEMYGLVFAGHPHPGPLLLPDPTLHPTHPLRKDVVLERRGP